MKLHWLPPAIAASLLFLSSARADVLERVVAKVNGDIVTLTELTARQVAAAQAARVPPDRLEAFLRENNSRILQEAVDEMLIVQRAAETGFQLRPDYINQVIEDIKKEQGIETDQQMQEQLRREGLTLSDLKRNIERSILRNQVLTREVQQKNTVTEQELRAEYEARRETDFARPAKAHLYEILIAGPQARQKAAGIATRARSGEDFGELARESSSSPSREGGGDLGTLERGDLHPEVEKVAFALKPGEVSEPFASGDGFRVLKLGEKTDAGYVLFEEVKAQIQQDLLQQRVAAAYDTFIQKLRERALIDIKVREVPLEVSLPGASATAAPAASLSGAGAAAATEAGEDSAARSFSVPELSGVTTTPQTQAERVAPPAREQPKPAASPSPSPVASPTPPPA